MYGKVQETVFVETYSNADIPWTVETAPAKIVVAKVSFPVVVTHDNVGRT